MKTVKIRYSINGFMYNTAILCDDMGDIKKAVAIALNQYNVQNCDYLDISIENE